MRITLWSVEEAKSMPNRVIFPPFSWHVPGTIPSWGLARYILYRIRYNTFRIRTSSFDKVDTTPKAEFPLVTAQGIKECPTVRSALELSTVAIQVNQATLSLQIELISHMHIWGQSVSGPGSKVRTCHITIHCDCFMAGTTVEAYFYSLLWTWFLCPV